MSASVSSSNSVAPNLRRLCAFAPLRETSLRTSVSARSSPHSSSLLTADFCPRFADKNPMIANQACATRSIAAGTCSTRQATPNSSRKFTDKCDFQNQYSLLSVPSEIKNARCFSPHSQTGSDKTTQLSRLSAISRISRQNSRPVFRRANPLPCNPIAKTKRQNVGDCPDFSAGTIAAMVGEKNGTVPLSEDVLSLRS
jgi:hypothetical protein